VADKPERTVTIRQPVVITAIVTEQLRQEVSAELQEAADEIDKRLQQVEFAAKRVLSELQVRGDIQQVMAARQQIDREKQRYVDAKEELLRRRDEVAALEDGDEVVRNTTEAPVDVKVGDNIKQILRGVEIVVKDDEVIEIRDLAADETRPIVTATVPGQPVLQGDD